MKCPYCKEEIADGAVKCRYCQTILVEGVIPQAATSTRYNKKEKSKVVAGLFGIFLGGLGIHKFYLGKVGQGVLYLLLCWTLIPAIIGFIEGIIYLASSDEKFDAKYNS